MRNRLLTALTLLASGAILHGQLYINFMSSLSADGSYTTDGSNTWNQLYSDNNGNGVFDTIAATDLFNAGGIDSGIDFSMTPSGNDAGEFTTTPSDAIFQNPPATGFGWFDASVVELRRTPAIDGSGSVTYTFDGFSAADDVTFAFVIGREGSGTRRLTMLDTTTNVTLLDDAATNGANANWILHAVTGFSRYNFTLSTIGSDSPAATINAMSITVVPEPSTYALLGGVAALGLVMLRRRLRNG